jgi:hypothetical protein
MFIQFGWRCLSAQSYSLQVQFLTCALLSACSYSSSRISRHIPVGLLTLEPVLKNVIRPI